MQRLLHAVLEDQWDRGVSYLVMHIQRIGSKQRLSNLGMQLYLVLSLTLLKQFTGPVLLILSSMVASVLIRMCRM